MNILNTFLRYAVLGEIALYCHLTLNLKSDIHDIYLICM
jgi:hypothetical protein